MRAELHLPAPKRLGHSDRDLETTLEYLAKIRTAVCEQRRRVFLDLADCENITPAGCLMLAAEVKRCMSAKRDSINGRYPRSARARGTLSKFGFHEHLRFQRPARSRSRHPVMKITSRATRPKGMGGTLAKYTKLGHLFQHRRFSKEVGKALHEAVLNVAHHTFDRSLDLPQGKPGRWWMMGVVEHGEATFVVLDHGPGVPRVAPVKIKPALDAYWKMSNARYRPGPDGPDDRSILNATAEARRSGVQMSRRGRGFPQMIGLVESWADRGAVQVISGRGSYVFRSKNGAKPPSDCYRLRNNFPGTLIIWTISKPRDQAAREI